MVNYLSEGSSNLIEVKKIYKRVKGIPITAGDMKIIESTIGDLIIFAGGATKIKTNSIDLINKNFINEPIVIVQSRGVIDFIYCEELCTFKNEMWGYVSSDKNIVKFLFYYLKNNVNYFRNAGEGRSSFSQISLPITEEFKIPLIPVIEQKAIVEVLTNMDTHIENLTELIEKKKMIRDGALEDLMSCRTRIDGFDGEWVISNISKICNIYDGTHQTPIYINRGVKFVSVENIKDIYSSDKYISRNNFERDFKYYPEKGDVFMTRIGDVGSSCVIDKIEPIAYYVSLALFKNIIIDSNFLHFYINFSMFKKELDDRTLHYATPKKINKGEIGKCIIRYPKNIKEQKAIAQVLTSMDDEIVVLEEEKNKMMQIKEGAMDDLLTGRVRLKL